MNKIKNKKKIKKIKNPIIIERNIKLKKVNEILNLFDIYGNENAVLVNPVDNPGHLKVKDKILGN